MKYSKFLTVAALLSVVVSAYAYPTVAKIPEIDQGTRVTFPAPMSVVSPTGLPREFEGSTVTFCFTVDEKGVPHSINPEGYLPARLTDKLVPVLSQWRFKPATVNGVAVPMRVVLPIELRAET